MKYKLDLSTKLLFLQNDENALTTSCIQQTIYYAFDLKKDGQIIIIISLSFEFWKSLFVCLSVCFFPKKSTLYRYITMWFWLLTVLLCTIS